MSIDRQYTIAWLRNCFLQFAGQRANSETADEGRGRDEDRRAYTAVDGQETMPPAESEAFHICNMRSTRIDKVLNDDYNSR